LNRYTNQKIVIDDPSVADFKFTGTVFLDHLDEWLVALPGSLPVQILARGPQRVLVRVAPVSVAAPSPSRLEMTQRPSGVREDAL